MEVLSNWVATRDVEELFFEAQDHHAPYGWVLPIDKVAENPQLEARDWWVRFTGEAGEVRAPGAPYRFSETPWRLGGHGGIGADTDAVLRDMDAEPSASEHRPNSKDTGASLLERRATLSLESSLDAVKAPFTCRSEECLARDRPLTGVRILTLPMSWQVHSLPDCSPTWVRMW